MGVSVRGNVHPHLHSPCPRCGYATAFKQWEIRCGCSVAERRRAIRRHRAQIEDSQEPEGGELSGADCSHIAPLRVIGRYQRRTGGQ